MKKVTLNLLIVFSLLSFITKGQFASKPCRTADLVFNGNFALPGGFGTNFPSSSACADSTRLLTSNLNLKCTGWPNVPDHTPGGGTNLLVTDGAEVCPTPLIVWRQSVTACAGKTYTFSFWSNSARLPAFNLTMIISGAYGTTSSITSNLAYSTWKYHQIVWTAPATPASGVIFLDIKQNSPGMDRDFAIDDVSFRYCCPPISASASQTICAGTTVTLAATGATSYTWYPGAITGSSIVVTPSSTTTYTVKGMGGCACSPSLVSTTTTVTVLPTVVLDPNFTIGGDDISASDYTIHAIPVSTPPGFWWEISEVDLATGTIVTPNTTMTNAQTWWYNPFTSNNTFPGYNHNYLNYVAWPPSSPIPTPPYGIGTTPAPGLLKLDHRYRITRGTWGDCTPWTTTSKSIYMCSGCKGSNGPTFIVENDPYSPPMPKDLMIATNINSVKSIDKHMIVISPNPNNGVFDMTMDSESIKDIYIYDVAGKVVYENKNVIEKNININLNNQPKGIYVVRVTDGNSSITKKIIKE
ncbi:MAG: T9SS type A sorting domain-containing protein [Bacteroidota bacterium]|nr:T9SS type A sorting domain-containing protein [Bacteroidota bacterium]